MRFVPLSAGSQLAYLATEDVEIGGVLIRAGEGVMPATASANRDESVFPHADEVDVERTDIFQLGFGHGSHYCLGAHLARVELQVALDVAVRPLPRPAAGRSRGRGAVEGRLGGVGARSPSAPLLTPAATTEVRCEV